MSFRPVGLNVLFTYIYRVNGPLFTHIYLLTSKYTIITYIDPMGIGMMVDGYWNDGRPGPFCEEECIPVLKQEHNNRVWVCLLSGLRFTHFVPIFIYVCIYIYMYTNTTYTVYITTLL